MNTPISILIGSVIIASTLYFSAADIGRFSHSQTSRGEAILIFDTKTGLAEHCLRNDIAPGEKERCILYGVPEVVTIINE